MAVVKLNSYFETSSGAIQKINKKSAHAHEQKMILTTHRVAATSVVGKCQRAYSRGIESVTRTTPVSAHELEIRGRFTAVAAAVRVRAKDLMQISTDQAAFLAQKDLADGKKTMKAYLWKVCGDEWDQQHGN